MDKFIDAYIKSNSGNWSETTANSERYRLRGLTEELLTDGRKLYNFLTKTKKQKPYTVRTTFTRAADFVEYLIKAGKLSAPNRIAEFKSEHANLFKHAYTKKTVGMTFEQAAEKIELLADEGVKQKARQLLFSGMRYGESLTLDKSFQVTGKGGRQREVAIASELPTDDFNVGYHTFYRALKAIGLTPHALRKLCATKLVELGAQEADLMLRMGWQTSAMAALYVQAGRNKGLDSALLSQLKAPAKPKQGTTKRK